MSNIYSVLKVKKWCCGKFQGGNVIKKILITGGTKFVSKYAAQYFSEHNYEVYVLNRNTKPQIQGVTLIEGDRHELGDALVATAKKRGTHD